MDNKLTDEFNEVQTNIAKVEAEIISATAGLQKKLAILREQDSQLRTVIKEAMEANDVKKFENDVFSVTYVAESTRNSFDSTKFKVENPEVYEKYIKTTKVSSSIRIKVK